MASDQCHPSVLLDGVPIDVEIAPLIRALWDRGIETSNSCQDNTDDHFVWVEFASAADASAFLDIVVGSRIGGWRSLYRRAMADVHDVNGTWRYAVNPVNFGVDEDIIDDEVHERRIGPNDIDFFVSIRFPKRDLAAILRRLRARPALS
jgi:hypothetical protein